MKKLLILTQKIDLNDDLLGFMHDWVAELAKHCEQVIVICLEQGEYQLPNNIKVLSLGKETKKSKIKYLKKFFNYIIKERKNYDSVFVHMNTEYVILGGLLWKLWNKKVVLWYAHYLVNWKIKIASWLSKQIVTSTSFACNLKSKKIKVIGQGINTDYFKKIGNLVNEDKFQILFLGRISPVKDLETLVKAVKIVKQEGKNIFLNIVGSPTKVDQNYYNKIKSLVNKLKLSNDIKFWGKVSNQATLKFYNENKLYINLTRIGSFDKTTLEAMACECIVLVCNKAFKSIFREGFHDMQTFKEKDEFNLANKIIKIVKFDEDKRMQTGKINREIIIKHHSVKNLAIKIVELL